MKSKNNEVANGNIEQRYEDGANKMESSMKQGKNGTPGGQYNVHYMENVVNRMIATPRIFSPGGRKLPPLGPPSAGMTTPGNNLWHNVWGSANASSGGLNHDQNTHQFQSQQEEGGDENGAPNVNEQEVPPSQSGYPGGQKPGSTGSFFMKKNDPSGQWRQQLGFTPDQLGSQMFFSYQPLSLTPGSILGSAITPGTSHLLGLNSLQSGPVPTQQQLSSSATGVPEYESNEVNQDVNPEGNDAHDVPRGSDNSDKEEVKISKDGNTDLQETRSNTNKRALSEEGERLKKLKSEPTPSDSVLDHKDFNVRELGKASSPEEGSTKGSKEYTDEEKRKSFLERNRVAASKCRQRKKQLIQKMEEELEFYSSGYRELTSKVSQMSELLNLLKKILVEHKNCPLLISSLGGYEQLNSIVNLASFAASAPNTDRSPPRMFPSTVPTMLDNADGNRAYSRVDHENASLSRPPEPQKSDSYVQKAPVQLGNMDNAAQQQVNQPSWNIQNLPVSYQIGNEMTNARHSNPQLDMQDMVTHSVSPLAQPQENGEEPNRGIKAIQSMSNLQDMNNCRLNDFNSLNYNQNQNFNHANPSGHGSSLHLRQVSSMVQLSPFNTSQNPSYQALSSFVPHLHAPLDKANGLYDGNNSQIRPSSKNVIRMV